jgi:hypothetical protein
MSSQQDPLKNPDNGKVVVISSPSENSLATFTPERVLSEIERGKSELDANAVDPISEALLNASSRSGRSEAEARGVLADTFKKGDRVYHKRRKKEGIVKDVSSDGVQMKFDNGEKHWVRPENLVKL